MHRHFSLRPCLDHSRGELPEQTTTDETAVARAVERVRSRRKSMRVVFDTHVVASASFWRRRPFDCPIAWTEGRCAAVVSPALLAEYQETMEERGLDCSDSSATRVPCSFPEHLVHGLGGQFDPLAQYNAVE